MAFTRGATWLGAGPFRLAAGETQSLVLAIIAEGDSTAMERSINLAASLYQGFFVAATPPPPPRIVATQITPGSTRLSNVRILFENRTAGYVDPFVTQLAARYRTAPITGTGLAAASAGSAFAEAVLHAISTSFTSRSSKKRWQPSEYFSTVRGLLLP